MIEEKDIPEALRADLFEALAELENGEVITMAESLSKYEARRQRVLHKYKSDDGKGYLYLHFVTLSILAKALKRLVEWQHLRFPSFDRFSRFRRKTKAALSLSITSAACGHRAILLDAASSQSSIGSAKTFAAPLSDFLELCKRRFSYACPSALSRYLRFATLSVFSTR